MSFNDMVRAKRNKANGILKNNAINQARITLRQYLDDGVIDSIVQCMNVVAPGAGNQFNTTINQCLTVDFKDEMKVLREMVIQSGWRPPMNVAGIDVPEYWVRRRHGSQYEGVVIEWGNGYGEPNIQIGCYLSFFQDKLGYKVWVDVAQGRDTLVDFIVGGVDGPFVYYDLSEGADAVYPIVQQVLDEITQMMLNVR